MKDILTKLPGANETAVMLHLYYKDLWDEVRCFLAKLDNQADLYISIRENEDGSFREQIAFQFPNAVVVPVQNRGRDIAPFIKLYSDIANNYKFICKIHTKKSLHFANGEVWRKKIYTELMGSEERIREILKLFEMHPEIGIIGPSGYSQSCMKHFDANSYWLMDLSARLIETDKVDFEYQFPAGSMFWFRAKALLPLIGLNIKLEDFEEERGQRDSTLAHAVERFIPLVASRAGYETIDTHIFAVEKKIASEMITAGIEPGLYNWELVKRLTYCESRVDALQQELTEKIAELTALYRSTSWRITRLFRVVVTFFHKFK